jgi:hypothetical protein
MIQVSTYGALANVLMVDRRLEPRSGQTKDYTIGVCCFSAKHAALRKKSNSEFARNQKNVSEWNNMSCLPAKYCFNELAL